MRSLLPLTSLGLLVASSQALPSGAGKANIYKQDDKTCCEDLWKKAPQNLQNLTVLAATYYPAGSTYNETVATLNGLGSPPAVNLPAFCRFNANITTSEQSQVNFEVWLPTHEAWNERLLAAGNGGDSGNIFANNMGVPLQKYGFAVCNSNTGHFGASYDGTFALNNPESQIDFGYRAVHLSTVYSKEIVKLYYGHQHKYAYWAGCSSGGKQGLKEAQMFPDDFDAILAGAPANYWTNLNGWTQYVNAIVNGPNTTGYIAPPYFAGVGAEVLAQCDELDGVKDGVINRPGQCFPDYSKFQCGTNSAVFNSSTCLSSAQVSTLKRIHTNWTSPVTGEYIFPAYNLGGDASFAGTITGSPYGPAPSYFLYQVLNVTEVVQPLISPPLTINGTPVNETQLIELIHEAQRTDPGRTTAINPDLSPFFNKGGKLLLYVGEADPLIPTNNSHNYYQSVVDKLGNVDDSFRFYPIPGLGHCQGGNGAGGMGLASQGQIAVGGGSTQSPPGQFDAKHDALLALMEWREKGTKPGSFIATKYIGNDIRNGTQFTRKVCPYPQYAKYVGGDENDEASFECTK